MRPRVAFETLGCKLNQYETDAIASGFRDLGWEVVEPGTGAEAYVVNTCTVTNKADRKSHHTLAAQLRRDPSAIVVVTGCFAESARESLETTEGITFVVPNGQKNQIPALVDAHRRGEVSAPALPPADHFGFPVHEKVFHTRASLKIQDGCDNFCSFCIIPSVRGPAVSRPETAILDNARALVADGRKELVLTGVNLGRWSEGGRSFSALVRDILALEGDFRVRITSLEPDGLTEEFADLFLHPKMCPHLHLCLQSGSPRVLAEMRRAYSLDQYGAVVRVLRSRRPDLNLTTDLIVGFPGETEEDFEASVAAVDRFGFGAVHVFSYSRRKGTPADERRDQVPEGEKNRRRDSLQREADRGKVEVMEALIGSRRRVLVETPDEGRSAVATLKGLTEDYHPVRVRGTAGWNTWAEVRITGVVKGPSGWVLEADQVV